MKKKNYTLHKPALKNILKISDPFLMIDKVTNIVPFKEGVGVKNVKKNEWFYKCHFFNTDPMMPGTLEIEAMLQTTIAVLFLKNEPIKKYLINKCEANFFSKIRSVGVMRVFIEVVKEKNGIIESRGKIFFNKRKVSNGIFKFINPKIFKINVK